VSARGFWPSVLGAAPQGGCRLSTYEFTKKYVNGYAPAFLVAAIAAVAGDLASSLVKVPREVVTQRLQTGMYKNFSQALSSIITKEGPMGLYTGFASTAFRDMPFMVILFVTYDELKRRTTQEKRQITMVESLTYGGVSGGLAGFLTTPMDVIKTKIMTADCSLEERRKINMRTVSTQIWHEARIRGFFIGAIPRSSWWFCVCSIFFQTYESIKKLDYWHHFYNTRSYT